MDFSSLTEFPPLTQVMSPRRESTGNEEGEWAEAMAAAYMAGAQAASSAAPRHKRHHAETPDQPEASGLTWGPDDAATGGAPHEAAKSRLSFSRP